MWSAFREWLAILVWSGQPVDALVLRAPMHDARPRAVARETFHRLVIRLASVKVWLRQWLVIGACLPASALAVVIARVLGLSPGTSVALLLGLAVFVAMVLLALPLLMAGIVTRAVRDDAGGIVRRCFLRHVPAGTPDDLADPWRHGWLTSDGRPLSSEMTESDARDCSAATRALWWLPSCAAAALVAMALAGFVLAPALVLGIAIWKWIADTNPASQRAKEADSHDGIEGAAWVAAGGHAFAATPEAARQAQMENAARDAQGGDAERMAILGTTTGLFAARGDDLAPSDGLAFALGLKDLQQHLLVLGGTGSGKTSALLVPLAMQAGIWPGVGMVVMDGKGALPAELAGLVPGLRIIDPEKERLSLVAGLEPEQLVGLMAAMLGGGGSDPFWNNAAADLLRHGAVLAKAAGGRFWSLRGVASVAFDEDERLDAIRALDPGQDHGLRLAEALQFFETRWPATEGKVQSSIIATARTWIATVTAHPDLLAWADTLDGEDTADLMAPLKGGRIGILIPEHRYGAAGALVAAILKARLYGAIRNRAAVPGWEATGETPVLFVVDEAQEVNTPDDAAMLPIGRSLGLAFVAATQTVEGVQEKLGGAAPKWLGTFGSVIALSGRSPATDGFVAARTGATWRPVITAAGGMTIRGSIASEAVSGAIAAGRSQSAMLDVAQGGGRNLSGWRSVLVSLLRASQNQPSSVPSAQLGPAPVLMAEETQALLAAPDTAVACVTRGRVQRRDVIRLHPVRPGKGSLGAKDARGEVLPPWMEQWRMKVENARTAILRSPAGATGVRG